MTSHLSNSSCPLTLCPLEGPAQLFIKGCDVVVDIVIDVKETCMRHHSSVYMNPGFTL